MPTFHIIATIAASSYEWCEIWSLSYLNPIQIAEEKSDLSSNHVCYSGPLFTPGQDH